MATILLAFYWRHLANTTELSVCGGDAALCQITFNTCSNNATNLHHWTSHSTPCCPTTWRSYCDHKLLWRHFTVCIQVDCHQRMFVSSLTCFYSCDITVPARLLYHCLHSIWIFIYYFCHTSMVPFLHNLITLGLWCILCCMFMLIVSLIGLLIQ